MVATTTSLTLFEAKKTPSLACQRLRCLAVSQSVSDQTSEFPTMGLAMQTHSTQAGSACLFLAMEALNALPAVLRDPLLKRVSVSLPSAIGRVLL